MVNILPFRGLRFNQLKIKDISRVIAPPYDIISPQQKQVLVQSDPFNIVNLTLPEGTGSRDKYENAKHLLSEWINSGILEFDSSPCLYIFEENFMEEGIQKSFTGIVGILKVEDYGKGKVLRHEKTLSKPKEDRLSLLRTTRTNFEFIYTIYNDRENKIGNIINSQNKKSPIIEAAADYDNSLSFKFWQIKDSGAIANITGLMDKKTLLIADGHHRYETSRLYREEYLNDNRDTSKTNGSRPSAGSEGGNTPHDYILSLFVSTNQRDISIHPTHRVVKFKNKLNIDDFAARLQKHFTLEKIAKESRDIEHFMKAASLRGKKCFCFCPDDSNCYFATLKSSIENAYRHAGIHEEPFDEEFEMLDVNILHKFVLSFIIGDNPAEEISFLHTIDEVLEMLGHERQDSSYHAGFILNAPEISTVENLSLREKIMPQKSTYFYPKPCSGLVLYKFETGI